MVNVWADEMEEPDASGILGICDMAYSDEEFEGNEEDQTALGVMNRTIVNLLHQASPEEAAQARASAKIRGTSRSSFFHGSCPLSSYLRDRDPDEYLQISINLL